MNITQCNINFNKYTIRTLKCNADAINQKPSMILFNSTQLTQDANFPDSFINDSRIMVLLAFILKKEEKSNVIAISEDKSVSLS